MNKWNSPKNDYIILSIHSYAYHQNQERYHPANGTVLDIWPYNGGNNQRWTITSIGNGLYKLIGVGSGRSLSISGASIANSAAAVLWDFQNTPNEVFYLSSPADGYFSLIFLHSNRALDLNTGSNTTDQWEVNGGNNQQWQFQTP